MYLYKNVFGLAVILLPFCLTLNAQSLKSNDKIQVVVTVPENLKAFQNMKKLKTKRLQFNEDIGHLTLQMAQVNRVPKVIRKVQIQYAGPTVPPKKPVTVKRNAILALIRQEQQPVLKSNLEKLSDAQNKQAYAANYLYQANAFAEGDNGKDLMANQWHSLTATPKREGNNSTVTAHVKTGLFTKISLTTDTLPGNYAWRFPAIDTDPCEPFDRFYELKKLNGYGLDKFTYLPYAPSQRKIIRKMFQVYFDKNKVDVSLNDLEEVVDYLRQNNLTVLRATIEGYSSIEGIAEHNEKLQQQRAKRMTATLQRYNNEPINSDTVIVRETWDEFRLSIKKSPYQWLDTLTNDCIREKVNADPILLQQLEPFLKTHRKASLKLSLSARLSPDELLEKISKEFVEVSRFLGMRSDALANVNLKHLNIQNSTVPRPGEIVKLIESKLLGMMAYVDQMNEAGNERFLNLAQMADDSSNPEETRILLFYHMVRKYEEANKRNESSKWDSLFIERNWNNIFEVAQSNIIELIQRASTNDDRAKRIRQAVDIQFYTLKYVEAGLLSPEVLCAIDYPDDKIFYGLKLNQYAMAYAFSRQHPFSCYNTSSDQKEDDILKNEKFNETALADFIHNSKSVHKDTANYDSKDEREQSVILSQRSVKPTFNTDQKSDYYYFTKKLFLSKDNNIRSFVRTSDTMAEFDLYHLLYTTLDTWDPVNNHFYDPEIQLNEIDDLIKQLKSIDKHICPSYVNQLYLDYHLKSLIYIQHHIIPGDKDQIRIADQSMKYISHYYAARTNLLFPKLALHVLDQLHLFYGIPTKKASTEYAFELLNAAGRTRHLSEEEQKRWNVYVKMYPVKSK